MTFTSYLPFSYPCFKHALMTTSLLAAQCSYILFIIDLSSEHPNINNKNKNDHLTNSYWSIGSTKNVKADRAQTREMGGMETQFQCG